MRAADLLQRVLERKAEGELSVPSYDNMHTPDNHVGNKNMKPVKDPKKGLDTKRDEHPTADVGTPGKESRSLEGPGTKPKKMSEEQLTELEMGKNALIASLNLRYDGENERLLINHPGGASKGKSFYLPISRFKLERVLKNPSFLASPLSFYAQALKQSQGGPSQQLDFGEDIGDSANPAATSGSGGSGGKRRHAYLQAAREMIDDDEELVYDVAVNHGQHVGNVKDMKWFLDAVADWLEKEEYPVMVEASGELAKPKVVKMKPSHSATVRGKQKDEPKNKGEPGKVKKKEKRAAADGRMDANPVTVKDFKGGSNEHKSMKKMHEELEDLVGCKLNLNLSSKKNLSEDVIIDNLLRSYVGTALWASNDNGDSMDDKFDITNFAPQTLDKMRQEIAAFLTQAEPLLAQAEQRGYNLDSAMHDFWLTRNGHGAGFWDRRKLEGGLGDQLSEIATKFGEASLYVGDDGSIYQFSG